VGTRAGHWWRRRYDGRTRRNGTSAGSRRALPWRGLAFGALIAAFSAWLVVGRGSDARRVSREFVFTGGPAAFVVPGGVCRIHIEATGASGGSEGTAGSPGFGALATATFTVAHAERLLMSVGGLGGAAVSAKPGRGGWNGGGNGVPAPTAPTAVPPPTAPTDHPAMLAAAPPTCASAAQPSRIASSSPPANAHFVSLWDRTGTAPRCLYRTNSSFSLTAATAIFAVRCAVS
jgi:hypothetical protein